MPRKGGTTARGYGSAHQRERNKWVPRVKAGGINCYRCKQPIHPNEPWDMGHADGTINTRTPKYTGPEHRHCNRAAGQAAGQANRRRGTPCTAAALDWFNTNPEPSDALGA